jgi:hypothetical protein
MGAQQSGKGKWARTAVLTAAVAAWLIYDMATAVEAPSQALWLLQIFLLACAGVSCAGSLIMLARDD